MQTYIISPNKIRPWGKTVVYTLDEIVRDTLHGYSDGRQEGCLNPAYEHCVMCDGTGIDDGERCEDCNGTGNIFWNLCDGCIVCCNIESSLDDPNAYVTDELDEVVKAARGGACFTSEAFTAALADNIDPHAEIKRAKARRQLVEFKDEDLTYELIDTYIDELTETQLDDLLAANEYELEDLADYLRDGVYHIEVEIERNDNIGSTSDFYMWEQRPTAEDITVGAIDAFDRLAAHNRRDHHVNVSAVIPTVDGGNGRWATLPVEKAYDRAWDDEDLLTATVNAANRDKFDF